MHKHRRGHQCSNKLFYVFYGMGKIKMCDDQRGGKDNFFFCSRQKHDLNQDLSRI